MKKIIDTIGNCLVIGVLITVPICFFLSAGEQLRQTDIKVKNGMLSLPVDDKEIYNFATNGLCQWIRHERNKVDDMFVYRGDQWELTPLGKENQERAIILQEFIANPENPILQEEVHRFMSGYGPRKEIMLNLE